MKFRILISESPTVLSCYLEQATPATIPVVVLRPGRLAVWLESAPAAAAAWVRHLGFSGDAGTTALIPGPDGAIAQILAGVGDSVDVWSLAALPAALPAATPDGDVASYALEEGGLDALTADEATAVTIGWGLACYRYTRYRKPGKTPPRLVVPARAYRPAVDRTVSATALVRDLINTPAEDMGPADLAAEAQKLADAFGARICLTSGDALLAANYPAVHAVGRAAAKAPCLIDFNWGNPAHPLVCLVGKGVTFDSGGLDIKGASGMLLMKKDMGGAAHVLGLARMVMMAGLPVRLRVLIPAVENAISGNAFRPMDVLPTRKGLTVEVGNTDAEGRLILCDALAEADSVKPDLILDFATLTGAARVALGTDLPALFSNDEALAADLLAAAEQTGDPLWRLPLWQPYAKQLDSKVADLNNAPGSAYGGAITAALFLERFVSKDMPWAHIDLMAWNPSARPGRPEGGEALGLRAAYALLEKRYAV